MNPEISTAHDRGECGPWCQHPDHFVDDAAVDVDLLIHLQLEPADFEGMEL
jgi:hypothetical protein